MSSLAARDRKQLRPDANATFASGRTAGTASTIFSARSGSSPTSAVLAEYARLEGAMPDDPALMGRFARLSPKDWSQLRERLLSSGWASVENGMWVDADQLTNIRQQIQTSEKQAARSLKRWSHKGGGDAA